MFFEKAVSYFIDFELVAAQGHPCCCWRVQAAKNSVPTLGVPPYALAATDCTVRKPAHHGTQSHAPRLAGAAIPFAEGRTI